MDQQDRAPGTSFVEGEFDVVKRDSLHPGIMERPGATNQGIVD